MLGFLGPNGAGKTTAMRCIFGLTQPEGGEVRWNSHPAADADADADARGAGRAGVVGGSAGG